MLCCYDRDGCNEQSYYRHFKLLRSLFSFFVVNFTVVPMPLSSAGAFFFFLLEQRLKLERVTKNMYI